MLIVVAVIGIPAYVLVRVLRTRKRKALEAWKNDEGPAQAVVVSAALFWTAMALGIGLALACGIIADGSDLGKNPDFDTGAAAFALGLGWSLVAIAVPTVLGNHDAVMETLGRGAPADGPREVAPIKSESSLP